MDGSNILAQVIERLTKRRSVTEAPKRPLMDIQVEPEQDSSVGAETPTPRSGKTIDEYRVPTATFRPETNILKQKIDELMGRDYSKKRGENGETAYGKDYDQSRNLKDIFRSMGLGALTSVANAKLDYREGANPLAQLLGVGIGGAGGGGIAGGIDRNYDNKLQDQLKIAKMVPMYEQSMKMEDAEIAQNAKKAQIENIYEDNRRSEQSRRDLDTYRQGTLEEREVARISRQQDTKMRTVASMLNKLPFIDLKDPRFASIIKAAGDVGLPVTERDAKKNVKLIQDADTGAWTLALTDPISGEQEIRPITNKDGSQLTTTSSSKVLANAAGERQEKSFQHSEKMRLLGDKLEREMKAYEVEIAKAKEERDETRRIAAEGRAEESRKRVIQYQKELQDALKVNEF